MTAPDLDERLQDDVLKAVTGESSKINKSLTGGKGAYEEHLGILMPAPRSDQLKQNLQILLLLKHLKLEQTYLLQKQK